MANLWDYEASLEISKRNEPFYTLLFALIRKADTVNLARLEIAFPDIVKEFQERYNAPFGVVPRLDGMDYLEYKSKCARIRQE